MRTQEPDPWFDRIIDEAIEQDLRQQPNHFFVQKVMSNIYSISNGNNTFATATLEPDFSYRLAIVYGLSIAASIFIGYFIGDLNINPSTSHLLLVNFENINMNNLIAF
jgi:hypothetical protein